MEITIRVVVPVYYDYLSFISLMCDLLFSLLQGDRNQGFNLATMNFLYNDELKSVFLYSRLPVF